MSPSTATAWSLTASRRKERKMTYEVFMWGKIAVYDKIEAKDKDEALNKAYERINETMELDIDDYEINEVKGEAN